MLIESSESETPESLFTEAEKQKLPKKAKYECTDAGCNAKFKRLDALDLHVFKHTGVKKHACIYDDCGKSYRTVTHLKRHINTTHERAGPVEKTIPCALIICKQMFVNTNNMLRHVREVHENPKVYKCQHCEETFTQKLKLRRHDIREHTGVYPFNCEKCGKGLFLQYQYEQHVKACKVYTCPDCKDVFDKWTLFTQHCRESHIKVRAYKCEFCDKSYKKPSVLKEHVGAVHMLANGKDAVYKCAEVDCGKCYSYERNLKAHMRRDHSKDKSFKCEVENCGMEFENKQNLISHRRQTHKTKKTVTKSEKVRRKRKDAGIKKSSTLAKLANVVIDKELEKDVCARDPEALKIAADKLAEQIFNEEMETD